MFTLLQNFVSYDTGCPAHSITMAGHMADSVIAQIRAGSDSAKQHTRPARVNYSLPSQRFCSPKTFYRLAVRRTLHLVLFSRDKNHIKVWPRHGDICRSASSAKFIAPFPFSGARHDIRQRALPQHSTQTFPEWNADAPIHGPSTFGADIIEAEFFATDGSRPSVH